MDLFAKTKGLKLVKFLQKFNLYPFFRTLEGSRGNNVVFRGKELVMMGSNNYLGLTHHPDVIKAAQDAVADWGVGCTGSRFLNGNLEIHQELEDKLAKFLGYEAALVFASGFMANQGAISSLVGKGDHIFSDDENHACIIEGCRLAGGKVHVYKHGDMKHLEKLLKAAPKRAGKLVITDGVFSMTGRVAKLDEIVALAEKYNARTYVDDAHGLGTIGEGGRGTSSHFNVRPDVYMGTFSKSLACQGGVICGSAEVIDWIKHKARTFMFSAALSPANAAAAMKALDILSVEPERVEKVRENALYLKNAFDRIGFNTMKTETCVVPIFVGDDKTALKVCEDLLDLGVFTTPVVFPAVPKGHAVIRCSVMATHTDEDLDRAIEAFEKLSSVILSAAAGKSTYALADLMKDPNNVTDEFFEGNKIPDKKSDEWTLDDVLNNPITLFLTDTITDRLQNSRTVAAAGYVIKKIPAGDLIATKVIENFPKDTAVNLGMKSLNTMRKGVKKGVKMVSGPVKGTVEIISTVKS